MLEICWYLHFIFQYVFAWKKRKASGMLPFGLFMFYITLKKDYFIITPRNTKDNMQQSERPRIISVLRIYFS